MSKQLINSYYNQLHKIKQFGGNRNEDAISRAFAQLLNAYAEKKNLMLVEQVDIKTPKGSIIRPDGVVKNAMRLDFGFWEAKKGDADLDKEILDQYKEKKPKDATIAEKFNTYKFADHKEQVIDLLQKVCTVSLKTMEIVGEMENR